MMILSPIFIQTSFASDSSIMTGKYTLNCDGNYYDISYQISNARISNFTSHSNQDMTFQIQNSKKGIITVDIPRSLLMESNLSPSMEAFIDGYNINVEGMEKYNSTHRIFPINLPDGNTTLGFESVGYPETMHQSWMSCSVVPDVVYSQTISSPLKQFDSGIAAKNVVCLEIQL